MACAGDQSQGDALRERAAQLLQLAEDRGQAMADRDLRKPQLIGQPALADSAAPHSEQRDDIPGAGCAAAAEAAAAKQQQEAAGQHSSSTQSYAGPGLGSIVWGREKGWPHWPALLITKETSRGLCNLRKPLCSDHHLFLPTNRASCSLPPGLSRVLLQQKVSPYESCHTDSPPDSCADSFSRVAIMGHDSRAGGPLGGFLKPAKAHHKHVLHLLICCTLGPRKYKKPLAKHQNARECSE